MCLEDKHRQGKEGGGTPGLNGKRERRGPARSGGHVGKRILCTAQKGGAKLVNRKKYPVGPARGKRHGGRYFRVQRGGG